MPTINPAWQQRMRDAVTRAGIDLRADSLPVESRLAEARAVVPRVLRVAPGRIEWRWTCGARDDDFVEGGSPLGALWQFIKLANEERKEPFYEFARRFGVLGVCIDGNPGTTAGTGRLRNFPAIVETPEGRANWWVWEPLEAWRVYALNARAIVALGLALRNDHAIDPPRVLAEAGVPVDPSAPPCISPFPQNDERGRIMADRYEKNLSVLMPDVLANLLGTARARTSLRVQREWLGRYVTGHWIGRASLAPGLYWDGDVPRMSLSLGTGFEQLTSTDWPANTLFNLLAGQLAAFLCSGSHVARCAGCGALFQARTKPRADRPDYCGDGCRDEARKRSKREWAQKNRGRKDEASPAEK